MHWVYPSAGGMPSRLSISIGGHTAADSTETRHDHEHALRRSPNGAPASLIGAVVDELHATEAAR